MTSAVDICIEQDGLIGFMEHRRSLSTLVRQMPVEFDSYNVHIWTQRAWENSKKPGDTWGSREYPRYPFLFKSFGSQKMAEDYLLEQMGGAVFLLLSMSYNS
jgi:hypothetical protein